MVETLVSQRFATNMEMVGVDEVVQPGDTLKKVLGIHDLLAVPLLLLFDPVMDEEILEIIQQKEAFGCDSVVL